MANPSRETPGPTSTAREDTDRAVTTPGCRAAAAAAAAAEPVGDTATSSSKGRRSVGRGADIFSNTASAAAGLRGRQMGPPQQSRGPHVPRTNGQPDVTVGVAEGVLELHPKGYGFLRDIKKDYAAQETDPFVSSSLIEKYSLRPGILIRGEVGPGSNSQGPRLRTIESVDSRSLEDYAKIKKFDELTAINPFEQIRLETGPQPISMRVMDLLTPIGKGQRALIVAPPRTGKTILLQQIADSVSRNHPELHLIVLLIDERPEEVTEMRRNVRGEVIASSMDRDVESHVRTSQLIMERAKRIAESGGEVFVLLDSITRTAAGLQ